MNGTFKEQYPYNLIFEVLTYKTQDIISNKLGITDVEMEIIKTEYKHAKTVDNTQFLNDIAEVVGSQLMSEIIEICPSDKAKASTAILMRYRDHNTLNSIAKELGLSNARINTMIKNMIYEIYHRKLPSIFKFCELMMPKAEYDSIIKFRIFQKHGVLPYYEQTKQWFSKAEIENFDKNEVIQYITRNGIKNFINKITIENAALKLTNAALIKRITAINDLCQKLKMTTPYNTIPMPIEDLDLSVRSYNCLRRADINTVGDLIQRLQKDPDCLYRVRNLGKHGIDEILNKLNELGLVYDETI